MKSNPPSVGGHRSADMRKPTAHIGHKFNNMPPTPPEPDTKPLFSLVADPAPKRRGAKAEKEVPPKPQPSKESLIGKHRTQKLSDITADERIPQDIRAFLASLQK